MRTENILTLSTSPSTQSARKPRSFASFSLRHRSTYGRERRCYAGKELDSETGLYYYGARYLDPKTGRWLSGDPALGEYVPSAPVSEEAKKRNGSLPGMGGVFNYANLHVYHYAGNNPVKYTDPTGMWTDNGDGTYTAVEGDTLWDLYGADWQEKSGYTGDPTKLQIGEVVGRKNNTPYEMSESVSTDTEKAQNPIKTWWYKPIDEPLTDSEKKVQIVMGIAEMAIGRAGLIFVPRLALVEAYLMGDGANLIVEANRNRKFPILKMFVDLNKPYMYKTPHGKSIPFMSPLI